MLRSNDFVHKFINKVVWRFLAMTVLRCSSSYPSCSEVDFWATSCFGLKWLKYSTKNSYGTCNASKHFQNCRKIIDAKHFVPLETSLSSFKNISIMNARFKSITNNCPTFIIELLIFVPNILLSLGKPKKDWIFMDFAC